MKKFGLVIMMSIIFCSVANSTTIIVTSPEYNVRFAPLIVEAIVLDIRYEERENLPFALIRLQVKDHIVGNSPDIIEIRRIYVTSDLQFQDTDWLPAYSVGERSILTLLPGKEWYQTVGRYNGKFTISNNLIQNTGITVSQFKQHIRDVRDNSLSTFPEELPRFGQNPDSNQYMMELQEVSPFSCHEGESHLNDEFRTWDFTWNTSFLPAEMHYNPNGTPPGAPNANTIANLAELAYELWEDDFSFFSFQNASPFTTTEGQVNNNTSVILWLNLGFDGPIARAHPFPNTAAKIQNCNTDGPGSNRAVDVVFNNNEFVQWNLHFGTTPPGTFNAAAVDFVEVLAHELGHGLGLAHIPHNTNSIMHNFYGDRTGTVRGQTDGDLAARIYQHTVSNISGLSGSFPFDIAISGSTKNFSFTNSFTVPPGRVLELGPGVTFDFASGTGLIANGQLHIQGTSGNPVVLEPTGSSWAGIHLHGSGSSIFQADIQGADNGISIFNTSDISLSYLNVSNHSSAGIHVINSSGVFINNVRSVDNSLYGILVDGNNNYHWSDNALRDNLDGLRSIGGARLDNITRTRLADNGNGMVIREASWIYIASSSFVNNFSRHAVSIENSTTNARYNWWEQAPPDPVKFQEATGGTIDYSSWYTADPIPGVQFIPGDDDSVEIFASDESDLPEVIRTAGDLRRVVTANAEDPSEQLRQLDRLNRQIEPSVVPWVDILRMELLQIEGSHESAESIGLGLLEDISLNQNVRQTAAPRLFYSYLLGLKDYGKAAETLALLKELESPEFAEVSEEILAGLLEFYSGLTVADPGQLQFTSAPDDAILTNYPNPFNPSTIIRYQLPENGPVTLQVFDLLGRQVAELVNEVQSAGLHSIHFNAEHLSSGLYIYRLQAGDQVLTRQMSLVK